MCSLRSVSAKKSAAACAVLAIVNMLRELLLCAPAGKLSRDTGSAHEQQFVRAVIDLHDKYMQARA